MTWLKPFLGGPVVLDDVPEVVLRVVEQQPDLSVSVGEKYLQTDRERLTQTRDQVQTYPL